MALIDSTAIPPGDTGYDIDNSLKFEADNSEYMVRTMTSTGNRKTFTLSVWLKRTELKAGAADAFGHTFFLGGNGGSGAAVQLRFSTSTTNPDSLEFRIEGGSANYTNRVFRDTSAWYHIVFAVDTTQATDSNRIKLYVNGVQETSFAAISYPSQNTDTQNNFSQSSTYGQEIGAYNSAGTFYGKFCGYLAEYNHVDGQQLAPTEFGEFDSDSGIWKPKEYTGTYGTNGFYLDFEDSSSLGTDDSGNSNNFTLTNISAADQSTDTPTNNFCTFNPLIATSNAPTINEGAMHVTGGGGTWNNAYGSMGVQNGKWYYEYKITDSDIGFFGASTFPDTSDDATSSQFMYDQSFTIGYSGGYYYQRINGTQISNEGTGWETAVSGDIYGLFLNVDDQEFTVFRNGTQLSGTLSQPVSLNSAFSGHFIFPCNTQYENDGGEFNFGGYTLISNTKSYSDANGHGNFVYSPVLSGVNYYSICTKNIAEFG